MRSWPPFFLLMPYGFPLSVFLPLYPFISGKKANPVTSQVVVQQDGSAFASHNKTSSFSFKWLHLLCLLYNFGLEWKSIY